MALGTARNFMFLIVVNAQAATGFVPLHDGAIDRVKTKSTIL